MEYHNYQNNFLSTSFIPIQRLPLSYELAKLTIDD